MLGLRRHPGRRARALDVADYERKLEHHREPHRFRLQHDSRPGRRRHAQGSTECRTDRRADGRDLVFGLERPDAEVLVARELLEDRARRRDRVRAEKERQTGQLRGREQPVRQRLVPRDVAVRARGELCRFHLVRDGERLGGLAERVAGLQGLDVRRGDLGAPRAELRVQEVHGRIDRTPIEPRHQSEREHVLRALRLARGHAFDVLQRTDGQAGQRNRVNLELVERAVLERVRRVTGLLQIAVVERVRVDDQRPTFRQVLDVRLECRGVHRDEHVRGVTRRQDVVVCKVELEARDARQRAGRRPDLGREVRQRRDVVPEQRRLGGELRAGELHAVARIAREADDDLGELLDRLGHVPLHRYSE